MLIEKLRANYKKNIGAGESTDEHTMESRSKMGTNYFGTAQCFLQ